MTLTPPPIRPKEIRKLAGLTVDEAAPQVPCSPATMRRFERDARNVGVETAGLLGSWYLHTWHTLRSARLVG